MKPQSGFTIYELLITLLILGVVLGLGVPNLSTFLQNNRTTTQTNDVVSALVAARGEALSRGRNVALMAIGGDWNAGWQIIVDVDRNNVFTDAVDELVREYPAVAKATVSVVGTSIVFQGNGWPLVARTVTVLADNCKAKNQRQITMSNTGILTTSKMSCP